jgi:hypothetical protein
MSAGSGKQQSRLLPYLLVVLVLLLAYVVYTRLIAPGSPPAAVTVSPPPVTVTPTPSPAASTPAPEASPAVASPTPAVRIPPRPVGRANPFAALVTEQVATAARPTPPPPPPAPPPFFPGGSTPPAAGAGGAQAASPRVAGVLFQDGSSMAIVELGQKTYIVREGDAVEEFRVERIERDRVTLRRGQETVQLRLGGGE